MKRLIIAWLLLAFVILSGWLGQNYLAYATQRLETQAAEAQKLSENDEWETAYETCEKLHREWKQLHDILCLFVDHGMLENIEKEIAVLPQICRDRDVIQLRRHCILIETYADHLEQSEKLSWKNIL